MQVKLFELLFVFFSVLKIKSFLNKSRLLQRDLKVLAYPVSTSNVEHPSSSPPHSKPDWVPHRPSVPQNPSEAVICGLMGQAHFHCSSVPVIVVSVYCVWEFGKCRWRGISAQAGRWWEMSPNSPDREKGHKASWELLPC